MTTRGTQARQAIRGNSAMAIHFRTRFARNIRKRLAELSMTPNQLALKSGVSLGKLNCTLDTTQSTTLIDGALIAHALETTVDVLTDGCMDGPRGAE